MDSMHSSYMTLQTSTVLEKKTLDIFSIVQPRLDSLTTVYPVNLPHSM